MEKGKVSVIVPVYNMEAHIAKCLSTLLEQEYNNYEIILVDDGSTDGSSVLCDQIAAANDKVRAVHKQNGGLSSARNCGLREADGEYIIFPDPDDWVDEQYLSGLIMQMTSICDLAICGNYIVTGSKKELQNKGAVKCEMTREEALLKLLEPGGYCGFAWNKLYRMDIISENQLMFDEELGMAQDLHFAFRYILHCSKVAYDPEPHYFYYQHEAGVTNINHPLTARKISGLKTYDRLLQLAIDNIPEAVPMIKSTIANQNLSFMYVYFNSGMDDQELLSKLYDGFRTHKKEFFHNERYSTFHKLLGRIALVSPYWYFRVKKLRNGL